MTPLGTFTLLLLLALLLTVISATRIIGGQEVPRFSIKYQASLQSSYGHYCGATLVHPQWLVTAAHCWIPSTKMKVVLSEHNLKVKEGFEQVLDVSEIHMHFNFNYRTFNNDIMLIKLSKPAQLNANVQPATLPDNSTRPLRYDTCTVSGWGVTQIYSSYLSPVLRAVNVKIVPLCNYYYWGMVSPNMICAGSKMGGKDSCQGDSGGPLICNGKFEGIVSWGISCANPYFPGVYTRVRNYVHWINSIISQNTP